MNNFYIAQLGYNVQIIHLQMIRNQGNRTYRYTIFGDEGIGKTNIITRFIKDQFSENHNITLDSKQHTTICLDTICFNVQIFDTAGQQKAQFMKSFWRNSKDGFILAFSIAKRSSFESIKSQIEEVKSLPLYKNTAMILVGNKSDLQRQVQKKEAENLAKKFGIRYIEVSAKTSKQKQIESIFVQLIEQNQMSRFNVINKNEDNPNPKPNFGCFSNCQTINCQIF